MLHLGLIYLVDFLYDSSRLIPLAAFCALVKETH